MRTFGWPRGKRSLMPLKRMEVLGGYQLFMLRALKSDGLDKRSKHALYARVSLCLWLDRGVSAQSGLCPCQDWDYSDSQCTVAPREFVFMERKQEVDRLTTAHMAQGSLSVRELRGDMWTHRSNFFWQVCAQSRCHIALSLPSETRLLDAMIKCVKSELLHAPCCHKHTINQ